MDSLHAISIFVRVAEAKSFTVAAKRLGITPSAASKSLSRLEERLGVRLLHRTTRSVGLTGDGVVFFERCRHVLGELEDAETALSAGQSRPSGRLRVVMPPGFGRVVMVPILADFAERYDRIVVDVEFSNRAVDMVEEAVDAAIRIGAPSDARFIARKLCDIRYVTVASPEYLRRYGVPDTPDDLVHHRCLGYHIPHTNRYREWFFAAGAQRVSRAVSGNLNMNDGAALLQAALCGAGIATVATFLAADSVKAGRLAVVLPQYTVTGPAVWLEYPERRHLSSRMRVFVDHLVRQVPASVAEGGRLPAGAARVRSPSGVNSPA